MSAVDGDALAGGGMMLASQSNRSGFGRRWVAAGVGLLLAAGAMVPLATPAAAEEDGVPVATGPRPTRVLAASGTDLVISDVDVAAGTGRTLISHDNGLTTEAVEDVPTRPADVVARGAAAWREGNTVRLLNLATGDAGQVTLTGRLSGVSTTHAVVDASGFRLVDLGTLEEAPLSLDNALRPPSNAIYPGESWVVGDDALVRLIRYTSSRDGAYSRYLDVDPVPVAGGIGAAPFRISGWVPYLGLTRVLVNAVSTPAIEYVVHSGSSVSYCTRLLTDARTLPKASCRKLLSTSSSVTTAAVGAARYGEVIGLSVKRKPLLFQAGKVVKVRTPAGTTVNEFTGVGDPARPLVRSGNDLAASTYAVDTAGVLSLLYADLTGPKPPSGLDLSATRLTGLDGRERAQGWYRPVDGAGVGDETLLAGATRALRTSAGRMVADTASGLRFYDRDVLTGTAKAVSSLQDVSGPYTWVKKGSASTVLLPGGTSVGTRVAAIFGSRVVEFNAARTGGTLRDLVTGVSFNLPPVAEDYAYGAAMLFGDFLVLASTAGEAQLVEAWQVTPDHLGDLIGSAQSAWPVAMGDGVVVLFNSNTGYYHPWPLTDDFNAAQDGSQPILDAAADVAPAVDGDATLVYSTGTRLLTVDLTSYHDVALVADTEARVLGSVAPARFEVNATWTLDLDLTKAVDAGKVEILDGTGAVVRTIATPASTDGSLRAISWDAMTDLAEVAPDGTYTWRYVADSADGTGAVTTVAGDATPTGTVTLFTTPVKAGTQKVAGTPRVGATVSASGTWTPPLLTMGYRWFRSGVPIDGATAARYTIVPDDLGKTLAVEVTGTSRRGSVVTAMSKNSARVAAGRFAIPTPKLTGTAAVGQSLVLVRGDWSPEPAYAYEWYRGTTRITGLDPLATSYELTAADKGRKIRVKVVGSAPGYTTASAYTAYSPTVVA